CSDCCPRATTGQATAVPTSVMNSRRLIASPEAQDGASYRLRSASLRDSPMSALGQKRTSGDVKRGPPRGLSPKFDFVKGGSVLLPASPEQRGRNWCRIRH